MKAKLTGREISKKKVVAILEEMALLLELKGANIFKVRAFENAARSLEMTPQDLPALIESGELEQLKGIGKGIAAIVNELFEKGQSADHEDLKRGFPPAIFELFEIPGLGAKRIKILYEELGIKSAVELEYACHENRLLVLPGFGVKMQAKVLEGLQHFKKSAGKFLISKALHEAALLKAYLEKQPGVTHCEIAGSLRRSCEEIGDIDVLVCAKNPQRIHEAFARFENVARVTAQGRTKSSLVLKSGMACDLRTVAEKEFASALYYFTGSKEHNVAVRALARKQNIKVNEYGVFKGQKRIKTPREADIFKVLGMHYMPPEVRENMGEIEWARKRPFPPLIEEKDLRGVFHVHTTASDGRDSLEVMVRTAEKMGLEYIGISDHSRSAHYASGLDEKRVRLQWQEMDALQKKTRIRIFKGIESDILRDGALDYPDAVLAGFDFVIGSVHSQFNLPEKEMTRRLCRALENPYLTFLGHPSGRLLLGRAGYAFDLQTVLACAAKAGAAIELNANPHRLDLDWHACREAKKRNIPIGIHPDAHSAEGLGDLRYGVGIARKAWLEKKDVLNTKSLNEMEEFLAARRQATGV